jgi:transposase
MGVQDAVRLAAIREAVAGRISIREAMRRTGLSRSQVLRYKRRYRRQGPRGLLHGNRGRPSTRRIGEAARQQIVALLEGAVVLNDCHLRDLLAEDGVQVSADTVRRVRQTLGRPPKQRRRARRYRQRREREAQVGAMVLIDGSPFRWLGESQPLWTLLGALDDATGQILTLVLRPSEDLHGYTLLLRDLITGHGVPWTLYGDRAAILVRNDRHWTIEEELAGRQRPSHFGLMLEELGVRYIAALSPQAKGRIERLWRTLQDRLAAELALHDCRTPADATAFLPGFITRFNRTLARPAQEPRAAWRPAPRDLDRILACRYPRVVALDHTVPLAGETIVIPPGPAGRSYARCRVEIRELLDGRVRVFYHGRLIAEHGAPREPFTLMPRASTRVRYRSDQPPPRRVQKPPAPPRPTRGTPAHLASIKPARTHVWRRGYDRRAALRKEDPVGVS